MRRWLLNGGVVVWTGCLCAQPAPPEPSAEFRIERTEVPGGAELLTVMGRIPDAQPSRAESVQSSADEVPLLSVLRDTRGDRDPGNDRLRYVWVLTSSSPTLLQRAAAATPFFYWRAGIGKSADRTPAPVLDLSSATKPVWTALAGSITQAMAFDPNGAILRSSTRSYRNNTHDHRQLHLLEGLAVLSQLENVPEVTRHLSEPELLEMQARLALAGQTFGGLVSESHLPDAYIKQRTRTMEDRGHSWELLRQRAESNGLYFEPFGLNGNPTQALLWVAREDLNTPHDFDGQFLSITDPFKDDRLKHWDGYTNARYLESEHRTVELIPLALYSLDHPKVPLLLVDFRNTKAPRHREVVRHAAVDAVAGVAGYSKWGNWPYFAGSWAWNFIRARHGVANNRTARIAAYSQVRQWLALDPSLDPALREELRKRLEILGVNPLEDSVFNEAKFARRQYAALLAYAQDPQGLSRRLNRSRNDELAAYDHSIAGRAGLQLAHYATLGIYQHTEKNTNLLLAPLDVGRRSNNPGPAGEPASGGAADAAR